MLAIVGTKRRSDNRAWTRFDNVDGGSCFGRTAIYSGAVRR